MRKKGFLHREMEDIGRRNFEQDLGEREHGFVTKLRFSRLLHETPKFERQELIRRKAIFFIPDASSQGKWQTTVPENHFPRVRDNREVL